MPSKKKKSKAKGRKATAGKCGKKGADNVSANEGTLNSEMQRLQIVGDEKGDEDDVEAMLEEAIKLAAVERQEIEEKEKEKENWTHGYNPSSIFQARFCEDFLKTFTDLYYASTSTQGESRSDRLTSFLCAVSTANGSISANTTNISTINPFCLAEGVKFILDGKSHDARLCAVLAMFSADEKPDIPKMHELLEADEHTLIQFFRKQIPCSCLDEKYKEVKSIPKMGICYNPECPLPGRRAIRSKMFRCTGCIDQHVSYCSRECQEANWATHKKFCGLKFSEMVATQDFQDATKTAEEIIAIRSNK